MSKPQFCRKVRIYPKRIWSEKSQNFLQIILNLSVGALQRAANGRERKRMLELTRLFTELKKTLPTNGQILSKKDILLQVHTYIYTGCPPQNFGFAPVLSCRSWEGFFMGEMIVETLGTKRIQGAPKNIAVSNLWNTSYKALFEDPKIYLYHLLLTATNWTPHCVNLGGFNCPSQKWLNIVCLDEDRAPKKFWSHTTIFSWEKLEKKLSFGSWGPH